MNAPSPELEYALSFFLDARRAGASYKARCPCHAERTGSLSISLLANGAVGLKCFGCDAGFDQIIDATGMDRRRLFPATAGSSSERSRTRKVGDQTADEPEHIYQYPDATGKPYIRVLRLPGKNFRQQHWDGGEWRWGLNKRQPVLYRLPEVLEAIRTGKPIWIVEGEKDADSLVRLGMTATCSPMGAGKFRAHMASSLRGGNLLLLSDLDEPGEKHRQLVAKLCLGKAASIRTVDLPGLNKSGADVSDWLALGHDRAELEALAEAAPRWNSNAAAPTDPDPPRGTDHASNETLPLEEVLKVFRRWLFLPDDGLVKVVLGAIAANYLPGDPVWLMLIAASGGGKTEVLQSASELPKIHVAATITESALLSGTPNREKAHGSRGGLLRDIGDSGILLLKDFTSILSANRDARAAVLAALREIHDGSWTRHVGTDGGKSLSWSGKLGIVAGCTPIIDSHHAVIAGMGERFVFYRPAALDERGHASAALSHVGREPEMRQQLKVAVKSLFAGLDLTASPPRLDEPTKDRIAELATLASRCRSAVERDSHNREITLIPGAEAPGRLACLLAGLFKGMIAIGIADQEAWRLVVKTAFDCMPALRLTLLRLLADVNGGMGTTELGIAAHYPTGTTRRALEDLEAYGIVKRESDGQGRPDQWELSTWGRERYTAVTSDLSRNVGTAAEAPAANSETLSTPNTVSDDFSGKVPSREALLREAERRQWAELRIVGGLPFGPGKEAWESRVAVLTPAQTAAALRGFGILGAPATPPPQPPTP